MRLNPRSLCVAVILTLALLTGMAGAAKAKPLAFTLDAQPYRQLEAQSIADQLKKLGIKVEVRAWERSVLRQEVKAKKRAAYLESWGSAYFDPFDLGVPKLTTGGRGNFSFYANPELDKQLALGSTSTDNDARQKAYFTAQKIIMQDMPWVFGYTKDVIEACSAQVSGFEPSMDNRINLHDVEIKGGKTIIVGMNTNAFISLDPAGYRGRETETLIRNIFDGLVTRTRDGKVVPELAEKWELSGPTTYEFTLRPGVKFHNGDPLGADDVVFTFQRVLEKGGLGGKSSPRKGLLGPLAKVEKISENKVRFILDKPFPTLLQALVHFQIVPQKYIEKVGVDGFSQKPVGAGPFKFVRGKLDSEVVLSKFDGYYGGAPDLPPVGPAKVQTAVFRAMPESSTRVAALLAGEVHIIQAVPPDLLSKLQSSDRVKVLTAQGTRCFHVELNTSKPPFDDPKVRKALNHAVNWDSILKNIYQGRAERLSTCFLPSGFGYNPGLKPAQYDPDLARKLLKEAGYDVK